MSTKGRSRGIQQEAQKRLREKEEELNEQCPPKIRRALLSREITCLPSSASEAVRRASAVGSARTSAAVTTTRLVATSVSATWSRTARLWLGFINGDLTATKVAHIGCRNCFRHLFGFNVDETKAATFNDSGIARTKFGKMSEKLILGQRVWQVANE